jgi:hypothetical protein
MSLKLVLLIFLGISGYFFYESQLGPQAFTLDLTIVYESANAAMNVSERSDDTVVATLDANTEVLIVDEMESQSWNVCEIKVHDKMVGWVRCKELNKKLRNLH